MEDFRWECPYPGCPYSILSYTESSFSKRRDEHLEHHLKRIREERAEREERLKKLGINVKEVVRSTDVNKLVLTYYDMTQFEVHHIKIDEDCLIDGYGGQS